MKIKDFAGENCLTQGAIYKAIARAGHSTRDLTDKRGNLTRGGLKILRELFPDTQQPDEQQPAEAASEEKREPEPENIPDIDELRDRLRAAEERADKWERLYLELQTQSAKEREALREEVREAHILTARAQEATAHFLKNPIRRLLSGWKKNDVSTDSKVD